MADEIRLKIVVFGAFGAGKTTLIQSIDPESKHIEANCSGGTTTVALDFGRLRKDSYHIYVYGTPGQERFEFAREIIANGMDGAILLVDTTSPLDEFTSHVSDSLRGAKVPFVVFLNKCDCIGSNPGRFENTFGSAKIQRVSAMDRKSSSDAVMQFAMTLPPDPDAHYHHRHTKQ